MTKNKISKKELQAGIDAFFKRIQWYYYKFIIKDKIFNSDSYNEKQWDKMDNDTKQHIIEFANDIYTLKST